MKPELLNLLKLSVAHRASDLHLSPNHPPMLRIDGDLFPLQEQPILNADQTREIIDSIINESQHCAMDAIKEIDFSFTVPTVGSFRANAFQQQNKISCVFRIIPHEIPTLEKLNAPPVLKELLDLSAGLILVTGATGCGKSTTLAAMIEFINMHHRAHIITLEDPIEFIHTSKQCLIHQRQIFRDTSSFSSALRAALREDPDVILVGEMRDLETVRLALTAAETGHLVMATLHTHSAPRAINRIIDVFPSDEKNMIRNLLAESLQAVICQTLVKKNLGGRAAAYEIMLGTSAIRHLIREDKIVQMYSVMQTSTSNGMCTMEQALSRLASAGSQF